MEDLPTSLLTQQERARPRTGEELEVFGKYASRLYLKGESESLTAAVTETIKSAGLSPEQVKRVVEFANTSAYLEKFASSGQEHKVISFKGGPASFSDIIKDLNDGGDSELSKAASVCYDYALPPPDVSNLAQRNLQRLGVEDAKLASAFASQDIPIPYEEPLREAENAKLKLASLYDEANYELSGLQTRYMDVCDLLFGQVKQASLEGVPLGHVLQIWGTVTEDPAFCKAAFEVLTPRLVDKEIFKSSDAISESLSKTAGMKTVNPDHPMVGIFEDFCGTLMKMAATEQVQQEIAGQLDVISTFLVKAASKGQVMKEVLTEHIPKAWGAARDLAAKASGPAASFATDVAGETAGKLVGGAVKYSPHIAVGLVGEEAYQRAKNNPAVQAGKNFVLGRVPYTHQNMIRQYNMQMGV